ncbi:hypothetical protein BKP37_15070 [Anaerobacillus alkalilacustris]|uniref:Uncharacterized protein n=1 Tax=Anaerobacillus alkalilacustris TaxID=393763 RepID=A0A1S2LGV6_9BACI|nr:hypothetical protein BKP37_15070 [Anaerobacillus alkalilacustris]
MNKVETKVARRNVHASVYAQSGVGEVTQSPKRMNGVRKSEKKLDRSPIEAPNTFSRGFHDFSFQNKNLVILK